MKGKVSTQYSVSDGLRVTVRHTGCTSTDRAVQLRREQAVVVRNLGSVRLSQFTRGVLSFSEPDRSRRAETIALSSESWGGTHPVYIKPGTAQSAGVLPHPV